MRPSRCSAARGAAAIAAALLVAGATRPAAAQSASAGIEGGAFLLLPVGARAVALGQAATADGGTSESVFWNPAGLAALAKPEFALFHYNAFFGTGDAIVLAAPTSVLGTFALTAYLVNYGDLAVTQATTGPTPVGVVSPRNIALMASYATDLGGLDAGLTYKLVQFRVDCSGDCTGVPSVAGTSNAVDVGLRYTIGGWRPVVVGVSLKNLGFDLQVTDRAQADPLPTRLAVGVSAELLRPAAGLQGFDARVLADVESPVLEGAPSPVTLVGVETGVGDELRIRAGYAFLNSDARGPSLGVGVKLGSIAFDLARTFSQADDIGGSSPVQINFRVIF